MPNSIASNRLEFIYAHQPHHAVLAAGLSGLSKVQEYPWGAVDTMACRIRGADQWEEPNVLKGPLTDQFLQPGVVAARSHLEHPLECLPCLRGSTPPDYRSIEIAEVRKLLRE